MREGAFDPEVLIQHYLEDCLTEAEAAALLEMTQRDPALAHRIMEHLHLDAMMREVQAGLGSLAPAVQTAISKNLFRGEGWGEGQTSSSIRGHLLPSPSLSPQQIGDGFAVLGGERDQKRTRWLPIATAAALAACVTLVGTWLTNPTNDDDEATTNAVAVMMSGVNAEWEGAAPPPGTPLTPGTLRLKSGLAQIEFYQGARVTLEGPANFELVSVSEARCTSGKLSAHVPPQARGFKIQTPKGTVVDLGTDFGLDLNSPEAQVHVFKGEIELHPEGATMQPLKEGEAMLLASTLQRLTANQEAFASLGNVDERTAESQRVAFEQWLQSGASWNADAGLLARLDFQDASHTRALKNHALHGENVLPGSIVGCQWTEGRWPGKRALEFRNVSDRVRLSIPGEHAAITLSAWVRIHGLDRAYNSLFMVEGYKDGAVHWQITREGRLRLGLAGRGGIHSKDHDTPQLFTPERFGQWLHLATCIDPAAKEVRHYLNGELVARVPRQATFPLRMPMAELGNWHKGGPASRTEIRHLSGVMDEFLLFNRVLSEAEIQRLAR